MKFKTLQNSNFKFEEMTAESMIEKLFVVTSKPSEIWEAFETIQPGFFEDVLLDKFQIGENFAKKVNADYRYEVGKY